MSDAVHQTTVEVDGRQLRLSNLDKVLYPAAGFTKAQVIDYYRRISEVAVPHLTDRPLTVVRFPHGVAESSFFTQNAPSHRPDWTITARLPSPGSTKDRSTIDYLVATDRPTLVWLANLAALELHTPMWRISTGLPDLVVADLDPGAPATVVDCARVALLLREVLPEPLCVKTSGSKGLQVYGRVTDGRSAMQVRADMRVVATRLEREHPDLVGANMRKDLRGGRVLLDWSQNNPAKTTVSVYSLRGRERLVPRETARSRAHRDPDSARVLDRSRHPPRRAAIPTSAGGRPHGSSHRSASLRPSPGSAGRRRGRAGPGGPPGAGRPAGARRTAE